MNIGHVAEAIKQAERNQMEGYYLATGPFRRELYAKHIDFFHAGATHRERLFLAANQTGKTTAGAYEVTAHLTGIYPDWWEGKRFPGASLIRTYGSSEHRRKAGKYRSVNRE